MDYLRFNCFSFELNSLELCKNKIKIPLRPKTALLLNVLINHRDSVLTKQELAMMVWGTEHVSDQSLFQTISELRQLVAPLKPIKTFPNRGYQWIAPVRMVQSKPLWQRPFTIAASFIFATAIVLSGYLHVSTPSQQFHPKVPAALTAFAQGIEFLQDGDIDGAEQMLIFSVEENPLLMEAQLLLAEVSLQQGNALAARSRALSLLEGTDQAIDAYTLVSAMDVVSRSEAQLGENSAAVKWATEALHTANTQGFVCTAYDLQSRLSVLLESEPHTTEPYSGLVFLESKIDKSTTPKKSHQMIRASESDNLDFADSQFSNSLLLTERAPDHCSKLKSFEIDQDLSEQSRQPQIKLASSEVLETRLSL